MITHILKNVATRATVPKIKNLMPCSRRGFVLSAIPFFAKEAALKTPVVASVTPAPKPPTTPISPTLTSSSTMPTSSTHAPGTIKLLVGERTFITTRRTLITESGYFKQRFATPWGRTPQDGAYFIDADPVLFEHILRYLRHPAFPLFYDHVHGHDVGLYASLHNEATYFQISRLQKWLSAQRYLEAIQVKHTMKVVENWNDCTLPSDTYLTAEPYREEVSNGAKSAGSGVAGSSVCPGNCCCCRNQGKNIAQQGGKKKAEAAVPKVEPVKFSVVTRQIILKPEVCMPQPENAPMNLGA
ncbi:hypothetical protein E4U17_005180 [Claviceps sp. LM77 group G4]|nr:hypothetical protein E4U17_005180 [Claviceps sp. LM77 group G4]KAG6062735.1 hypothetical protein E4U33_006465 [Claviceps sp. LM78 group G4]KAG6079700.1 hypothetical protein E4U16_000874 [Claviceps sp. LM84 group G4]